MSAKARLRRLLGYQHAETLEAHLYFTLCFMVSLGGLLALTINLALNHFLGDILVSLAAVVAGVAFSLVGRRIGAPERLSPLIILMIGAAVGFTWFTNAGISGSSMAWFAPLIVITTVLLRGAARVLTLVALLVVLLTCTAIEYLHPELVTGHSDPVFVLIDNLAVFVATGVILALVTLMLTQAYRQERRRVAELVETSVRTELEMQRRQQELEALRDLLPLCAHCHQIRDEQGSWHALESYMHAHRSTEFSHGICPTCADRHFLPD